jgi:hypothetical protein
MKTYCEGCRYFESLQKEQHGYMLSVGYQPILADAFNCNHPKNIELVEIETVGKWLSREVVILHKRDSSEINANNDCQWFRRRNLWGVSLT